MGKTSSVTSNDLRLFTSHSSAAIAIGVVGERQQGRLERMLQQPHKYALTELANNQLTSAKPAHHQLPITAEYPKPDSGINQMGIVVGERVLGCLDTKVVYIRLVGDYPTGWDGKVQVRCVTPGSCENEVLFEADFYKGSRVLAVAGGIGSRYLHYNTSCSTSSSVWYSSLEEMLYLQGFGEMTLESLAPLQKNWA